MVIRRRSAPIQLPALLLLSFLFSSSSAVALFRRDLVSREVVQERLERVTRGNKMRRDALESMFLEAGCRDENLTRQPVPQSMLPNVLCTLPGQTDRVIILAAHFDMRGPGLGVIDNWTSTSLLPSVFQSLAQNPRRHTFVFIGFSDEERGLIGAKHYVQMMSKADRARLAAMVNMDGVGILAPRVWASRADPMLLKRLKEVASQTGIALAEFNLDGVGMMDSFPFDDRRLPSISLHSLAPGNWSIPHSQHDQMDAADPRHLYDSYRLVVAYLLSLDAESPASAGR